MAVSSRAARAQQPSNALLDPEEVTLAVRSLIADDLKPFGRMVLKRIRERAALRCALAQGLSADAADPESMPRIEPKRLRAVCEACPELLVSVEEGKEYSVSMRDEPTTFLEVTSSEDPYPEETWERLSSYIASFGAEACFPGGRYACAQELLKRDAAGLSGLSLAQACHIVHLATTKRKIFGYRGNVLVPYQYSSDHIKVECALAHVATGKEGLPSATWQQAIACLRHLVHAPPASEPHGITISNVKRLFRDLYGLELCETALGHVRLLELLRDARFKDSFASQEQKNGQFALRPLQFAQAPPGQWNVPGADNTMPLCYPAPPSSQCFAPPGYTLDVDAAHMAAQYFEADMTDMASIVAQYQGFEALSAANDAGISDTLAQYGLPCSEWAGACSLPPVPPLHLPLLTSFVEPNEDQALLSPGASPRSSPRTSPNCGSSTGSSTTVEECSWSSASSCRDLLDDVVQEEQATIEVVSWKVEVRNTFVSIKAQPTGSVRSLNSKRRARSVPSRKTTCSMAEEEQDEIVEV